jgi:hypothetical protein
VILFKRMIWGRRDRDVRFLSGNGRPARSCVPVRGGALVEALEGRGFRFWRVHFQLT